MSGLWRLKRAGYRMFTGGDLAGLGCPVVEDAGIYAVVDVEFDGEYADWCWDGAAVNELLLALERRRGHLWQGLYRRSPDPRVLGWRICGKRGCEAEGPRLGHAGGVRWWVGRGPRGSRPCFNHQNPVPPALF